MKIYFATGNSGKVENARNILSDCEIEQLDVETVEPQSGSIEESLFQRLSRQLKNLILVKMCFLLRMIPVFL